MSSGLHIFTSAAVNYLPKVRTLCRSIRRHHPEATIHLALADERPDWLSTDGEPFDSILEIGSLSIPDWRAWSFMHNIVELATAIKPFALAHLLARPDCHTVVYFDPDMVLFSPVEDLLQTLRESNVALTAPVHPGRHPLVFTHDRRKAHYGTLDQDVSFVQVTGGGNCSIANARAAMGIPWMNKREINEAIPPAYARFIGGQLISKLAWPIRSA